MPASLKHWAWRSAHRAALQRGCTQRTCLRAAGASLRNSNSSSNGTGHDRRVAEPLTLERIPSLSPAALAAALLEHTQHRSLESAFGAGIGPGTGAAAAADPALLAAAARHVVGSGGGLAAYDGPALVDLIAAYSCRGRTAAAVDSLGPADLTRLAGACAAAGLAATDMLAAACSRASELLPQYPPGDLVSLLSSLSALGHRAPALFADAADATLSSSLYCIGFGSLLMDRLGGLDGNTLARIAWAYATIRSADEAHRGVWDRDLFDGIASTCLSRAGPALASTFPPRALVTLLWSYASIPHYDQPLFEAVSTALAPRLGAGEVAPSDLVAVAWYLVTEAQARPGFFGQVALLDIIRLISRVQDRDPDFYKPALEDRMGGEADEAAASMALAGDRSLISKHGEGGCAERQNVGIRHWHHSRSPLGGYAPLQ
eukprot:XP_001694230.1 predicted protein [Chlamydomonas reinhardtii]